MSLSSLAKKIQKKFRIFRVLTSRHIDKRYYQLKIYRGCAIDLTMRVTSNWNEVWSYYSLLGDNVEADDIEVIGKGNGLATEEIAMECAKKWIDDVLRDRKNIELRKNWLSKKMKRRHKHWLFQYLNRLKKVKISNKRNWRY